MLFCFVADHGCDKCHKKFKSKKILKSHKAIHDRADIVKPCPYDNCPRFYCYLKNLDEHVQSVHLGRRFYCDTCGKSFKHKSTLARHIQVVHEGTRKSVSRRKNQRQRRKDAGVYRKSMVTKLAGIDLPRELEERVLRRSARIRLERVDTSPDGVKKCLPDTVESATLDSLEKFVEGCRSKFDRETPNNSSFPENESRRRADDVEDCTKQPLDTSGCENEKASLGFVKEVENESSMAVDDYAEEIVETSGGDNEKETESNLPSEESMIVDENFDTIVEENEEELLSALLGDLEYEASMTVAEKYAGPSECEDQTVESSLINGLKDQALMKVAEKHLESSESENLAVRNSIVDVLENATLDNAKPIVLAQYGEESLVTSEQAYEKISLWLTDSVDVTVPLIFRDNVNELS